MGLLDDVILLSLILDYFFSSLDQSIILSHFPWNMKAYARLKRLAAITSALVPGFLKEKMWKYTRETVLGLRVVNFKTAVADFVINVNCSVM
jgi:hypothetical protein